MAIQKAGNGIGRNYMTDKAVNKEENNKVFFDSNIFVYSIDENDTHKKEIAKNLLIKHKDSAVISTQNLQEFYNASTKRLGIDKNKMKQTLEQLSKAFPVKEITPSIIFKAIDIQIKNTLSFYDSLIISTASKSGCIVCYSEDLNNGQVIDGVKVINPFCA